MNRRSTLKEAVNHEIGQLGERHALLVALQFAAAHDCDFSVSEALRVIRDRVEASIDCLDKASVAAVSS